jgi:murein DD-endopeptidase MepM/ murein hydrolase activator NlpD
VQTPTERRRLQATLMGFIGSLSLVGGALLGTAPALAQSGGDKALEHEAFAAEGVAAAPTRRTLSVREGETLAQVLQRAGATRGDSDAAIRSLGRTIDVRDIERDDTVTVFLSGAGASARLTGFNLASGAERAITVTRGQDNTFRVRELQTAMQRRALRVAGVVGERGLVNAVRELGAPDRAAEAIGEAFAFDVDFEREVGPGAQFELIYERVADARGLVVREGEPAFARLTTTSGRTLSLYRFQAPGTGGAVWYDPSGREARRFLMRTPINGARLTSGFGMRNHPVLGYNRMHTGVDFGAPVGTPILAAGDGVVTRAGWMGGYGNTLDIQHDGTWSTRYAHISRFATGLQPGDRVRQGDVIAFVGNTGRSTGPHLHYEVRRGGNPINPMGVDVPQQGRSLSAEALVRFNAFKGRVDDARRDAMQGVSLAGAGGTMNAQMAN